MIEEADAGTNEVLHDALRVKAHVFLDKGDFQEAMIIFTKALEVKPICHGCISNRAFCYMKLANLEKALEEYNRSLKIRPQCRTCVPERVKIFKKLGQTDEAIASFDEIVEQLSPSEEENNDSVGFIHFIYSEKGEFLFAEKSYHDALQAFEKALDYKKDCHGCISKRARCFIELERFEDALNEIDKSLIIKPKCVNCLMKRGNIFVKIGDLKKANLDFEQALNLEPENERVLMGHLHLLWQMESYTEGLQIIDKLLSSKSADLNLVNTKGLFLTYLGKFNDAIEAYLQVLEEEPDVPVIYNLAVAKVRACGLNEDTKKDIVMAKDALESDERDTMTYYYGLAGLAALMKDNTGAIENLKRAISKSPEASFWAKHDTAFLELRDNEAFQELVLNVGSNNSEDIS